MRRLITPGAALAAALALGACGGGGAGESTTSSSGGGAAGGKTVAIQAVSGIGRVLVDRGGKAVYTPDGEASGAVRCTGPCTAFWRPVTPGANKPTADPAAGRLGVIKRPDGTMQVTVDGKPLYTFVEDSPGKVTGDGFSDDFGGRHFTWHAVLAGGRAAGAGAGAGAGSGGGSSSGYGYGN